MDTTLLCSPWKHTLLGDLSSRVVMSAMTRGMAGADHTATEAMAAYYANRARHGVGLILTEATIVHPSGDGYVNVPYISSERQADSWHRVTDAVHQERGRIFCQLWHCGRISHPDFLDGQAPVSSTAQAAAGINKQNDKPYGQPRRLEAEELPHIYDMFRAAARHAMAAGFDGVELHCGHGYLIDQFFDARVNDRTDSYGGSVANRCRFALELTSLLLQECGANHVMVRISPARFMDGPYDWPDLDEMLEHLIPAFHHIGLRLLDISCARADYFDTSGRVIRRVRPWWPHLLIGGASLAPEQAEREIAAGLLDLVTYGRWLIANPDLVSRLRSGQALQPFDRAQLDRLD